MSCNHQWYVYFINKVAKEFNNPDIPQIGDIQTISICRRCNSVNFYDPSTNTNYFGFTKPI